MDCSPPGSSAHGILQARILEWVAISSSRRSSWPIQGSNPGLLRYRQIFYQLSYEGGTNISSCSAFPPKCMILLSSDSDCFFPSVLVVLFHLISLQSWLGPWNCVNCVNRRVIGASCLILWLEEIEAHFALKWLLWIFKYNLYQVKIFPLHSWFTKSFHHE